MFWCLLLSVVGWRLLGVLVLILWHSCQRLSGVHCQVLTFDCRGVYVGGCSLFLVGGCRLSGAGIIDYSMGVGYRSFFLLGMPNSDICTLNLCLPPADIYCSLIYRRNE
jgi:hypothetical protein